MPVTIEQAIALHRAGRLDEAEAAYRTLFAADASNAAACHWLGMLAHHAGRIDEARRLVRRSVELSPNVAEFHSNLATVLGQIGRHQEALEHLQAATRLRPDYVDAWHNSGVALEYGGRFDEALAAYERALTLRPEHPETHTHRGNTLRRMGRTREAIAAHRRAIELRPDYPEAYNNLATSLADQGRLEESLACYRKLVNLEPDSATFHSNLLLAMQYDERYSPQDLFEEAVRWGQRHGRGTWVPHSNSKDPTRRLRVGYLSPDFRNHPVGRLVEPVLRHHRRAHFEVFCYSDVGLPDASTERLHNFADAWRTTARLHAEAVAELVRDDNIDVLVDLTGHFAGNRLTVFARKPAPVQVSWMGYPATTGSSSIGFRVSDEYSDPVGLSERYHTERLVRLPECDRVYDPPIATPEVGPLPSLNTGYVTFGCLNNALKISPSAVATFARILHRIPNSRLLMRGHSLEDSEIAERFVRAGVDSARIAAVNAKASPDYFAFYNRIDVALDPWPYNGDTTTCDALWMGVPVITLAGMSCVARRGVSHLSNVGLAELIARTPDEYVEIACGLAASLTSLALLRSGLRERMRRSPLCDGPRFVENLERSYRRMWELWCSADR